MRSLRTLLVLALLISVAACSGTAASQAPTEPQSSAPDSEPSAATSPSGDKIKIGLITKFPVDFFFTIENAAKEWAAAH
ncbi:MAG TPA: hypothetical protein VK871_07460, partial [Candidatus Limnocylindrales bacterium]|nr:hypothetical protein [Candidatus Limnocylindrales bacterium]